MNSQQSKFEPTFMSGERMKEINNPILMHALAENSKLLTDLEGKEFLDNLTARERLEHEIEILRSTYENTLSKKLKNKNNSKYGTNYIPPKRRHRK